AAAGARDRLDARDAAPPLPGRNPSAAVAGGRARAPLARPSPDRPVRLAGREPRPPLLLRLAVCPRRRFRRPRLAADIARRSARRSDAAPRGRVGARAPSITLLRTDRDPVRGRRNRRESLRHGRALPPA